MKRKMIMFGALMMASTVLASCNGNSMENDAKELAGVLCKVNELSQKAAESADVSLGAEASALMVEAANLSKKMEDKYRMGEDKVKFFELLNIEQAKCVNAMTNPISNTGNQTEETATQSTQSSQNNDKIPTIKATGGQGKNVNWPAIKAEAEKNDGPEFFYNGCEQGVTPLRASSTLAGQGAKSYGVKNLYDFNPMTAWVEGKEDYGIGESFEIKGEGVNHIYNGYQSSPKTWADNSRVKIFKVYKNNVPLCFLELKDEMGQQYFELPDHNTDQVKANTYKFEIVEVYPGAKWKDVAISEIGYSLCCFSSSTLISTKLTAQSITNLKEGNEIYSVDINNGKVTSAQVLKTTKQTHLSLLQIACENSKIEVTSDHPLYIKDQGFMSVARYMRIKNIENYADLVGKIEFMVWNEKTQSLVYEKLQSISLITGEFDTYSISKLKEGSTFIANGFVTKTY